MANRVRCVRVKRGRRSVLNGTRAASVLGILVWQLAGQPAHAQWVSKSQFELPDASAPVRSLEVPRRDEGSAAQPGTGRMVAAGMLGSVAGLIGGAIMGYKLDRATPCLCDDPGLAGAIIGAPIGSGIVIPLTVHLANPGPGNLGGSLGISALIGGVGGLLTLASGTPIPALVAPIVQIVTSIAIERAPREPDE